ncbi:hypothetical protein THAOC_36745 [Thalassiosira oceanica]|uniref:Uncharacterized protein n=1 Tax=Thalassiosira oceanica TaxID=159749 RepID=K0R7Q3_THAOC|nr:hypothetical protein THAOC_36745 [Thalassiosira oceanica]|eukprot:EJK44696.1 hypothetical protein THAOC_36745 [Thalassiosira oceanica]
MAMIMNASALLPLAKSTGRCPPALIRDETVTDGGIFELATLKSLAFGADGSSQALILSSDPNAVQDFTSAMKEKKQAHDKERECLNLKASKHEE